MTVTKKHTFYTFIFSMFIFIFSFSQERKIELLNERLDKLIDSTVETKKIYSFLDSISNLDPKTKKKINYDAYYILKGKTNIADSNYSIAYESFLEGVEYSKKNKLIKSEGSFYVYLGDLISILEAKNEIEIKKYLEKADVFYSKAESIFLKEKDTINLLDLKQAKAYNYFYKKKYIKSLKILLDNYQNFKDSKSAILLMNATHKIHDNYIKLGDKKNADIYYKKFTSLKNMKSIINNENDIDIEACYAFNIEITHISLIKYFTLKKNIDSSYFYIKKLDLNSIKRDFNKTSIYYELQTNFNKIKGDENTYHKYKDSLFQLLKKNNNKNIKNILDQKEKINIFKQELEKEKKKTISYYYIIPLLFISLSVVTFFYKRHKTILKNFNQNEKQVSKLRNEINNQQKIKIKIKESENFINEIKTDLKEISRSNDPLDKKTKIQDLFIKTHHKSSIDKFEGGYEQLYLLNPSFFDKLKEEYPILNESELAVCYYIKINFKNNEIASLQKKSIRSIESTRYRIRKKMNISNKNTTIKELI